MTQTKTNSNREIDLLILFGYIGKGLSRLVRFIVNGLLFLIVFGLRKWYWMLMFIILGIGSGYLIYLGTPRYYSSEMIAQPNGFTSVDMSQYINDIHQMCKRKNVPGISEAFQISAENADLIRNIEAYYYIDLNRDGIGDQVDYGRKYNAEDTTKTILLNRIVIRAEVLDNAVFSEVRSGLIRYINNNPYLIKVNDLRKRELQALIDQNIKEITKLDSLQNYEYYNQFDEGRLNREGQIVFLNEKLTQLYYRDKTGLLSRSLDYQRKLELATDPITIIKDFPALQTEVNPVSIYLALGAIIVGFTGYVILLLLAYRQRLTNYISRLG